MVNHCHLATKTSACCTPPLPVTPQTHLLLNMCLSTPPIPTPSLTHTLTCTHTHAPYGCIITVREAALRNNYRGWLLLLFPTNKAVHKQDGGVGAGSSHHPPTQPPPHPTQSASRASFCCLREWTPQCYISITVEFQQICRHGCNT